MSILEIHPSCIQGSIPIPPSKSQTLRALLFGYLSNGETVISNLLYSPDSQAMIDALRLFGAEIEEDVDRVIIKGCSGNITRANDVINVGNSGLVLRFIGAIAALSDSYTILTGDRSIRRQRPCQPLIEGLNQLGAFAVSSLNNGCAPLIVRGKVQPGIVSIQGEDSQPVSALLIAMTLLEGRSTLCVKNPGEIPWIQLTLDWLKRLGADIQHDERYTRFEIQGKTVIPRFEYTVPADLSTMAFPLCAALLCESDVVLENVDLTDAQGDKRIIDILKAMGAKISTDVDKKTVSVKGPQQLHGIEVDINDMIDALPILAVIGCFAKGTTKLYNGRIARLKESDRVATISEELRKMGARIECLDDGLIVHQSQLHGAALHSHFDHRIALSLAVASLRASSACTISHFSCANKTYSDFVKNMQSLGADMHLESGMIRIGQ